MHRKSQAEFFTNNRKTAERTSLFPRNPRATYNPVMSRLLFVFLIVLGNWPALWAEEEGLHGARRPRHLLAVLIGGIDSDPSPAQIEGTAARKEGNSGLYRFAGDLTRERVVPEYFNWNGTRAGQIRADNPPGARGIAGFMHAHLQQFPGDQVVIVGNSWGGHTALDVARELRQSETPLAINLLVFIDASSTGRGPAKPKALPVNANCAMNYFTHNAFVWGRWEAGKRLENIDLGDPARGYLINGGPAYNAPIDVQAHVAAEWDEKIHEEIKRRLFEMVPGS